MTFKRFEEIFHAKYPDGEVIAHGQFGGTEKNKKTTVVFERNGKCYSYYGAYEDVLKKLGFDVISKERLAELEARLDNYKQWNGTDDFFGGVCDYTAEIKELTERIEHYKKYFIIA